MYEKILKKMAELMAKGETFAVVTIVKTEGSTPRKAGAKMIVVQDGSTFGTIGGDCVESSAVAEAMEAMKKGKSKTFSATLKEEETGGIGMKCGGMAEIYIEVIKPTPKLLIIGVGNIGSQLVNLGQILGFSITIIDPAARKEDFPDFVEVIPETVEKGVKVAGITPQTYIVVATGHKYDEAALKAIIDSSAAYIGMVGSKRKVAVMYKNLMDEGISRDKLKRVNTPVGLDIGAETPEEIAVSIMAEIIMRRRKPSATGGSLKISF